jgi:DNA polymerase (family 10)
MCKDRGVKVVISTDSHSTSNLAFIRYGVTTARRAWLTKVDVLNTLSPEPFLKALRAKPGTAKARQAGKSH